MLDPVMATALDSEQLTAITGELVLGRLQRGQPVCFTIISSSMQPWLAPGAQVMVRAVRTLAPGGLKCGDVVVVRLANGKWCTHRLIARVAQGDVVMWVTKGDSAPGADAPVRLEQIAGVVVAARRGLGMPWEDWQTARMRRVGVVMAAVSRVEDMAGRLGCRIVWRVVTKCARLVALAAALVAAQMICRRGVAR